MSCLFCVLDVNGARDPAEAKEMDYNDTDPDMKACQDEK